MRGETNKVMKVGGLHTVHPDLALVTAVLVAAVLFTAAAVAGDGGGGAGVGRRAGAGGNSASGQVVGGEHRVEGHDGGSVVGVREAPEDRALMRGEEERITVVREGVGV